MRQIFLAALFLALSIPSFTIAQPDFERGPRNDRLLSKLNLSDTQKEQFKKIRYETEKKNIDNRAKLETARLDMRRLFDSENIDRSAVEKKIAEVSALESGIKINHFNAWADCNKILNPDQQKIWRQAFAMRGMMNSQRMKRSMMEPSRMRRGDPMNQEDSMK